MSVTDQKFVVELTAMNVLVLRAGLYLMQEWCAGPDVMGKVAEHGAVRDADDSDDDDPLRATMLALGTETRTKMRNQFEAVTGDLVAGAGPVNTLYVVDQTVRALLPSWDTVVALAKEVNDAG